MGTLVVVEREVELHVHQRYRGVGRGERIGRACNPGAEIKIAGRALTRPRVAKRIAQRQRIGDVEIGLQHDAVGFVVQATVQIGQDLVPWIIAGHGAAAAPFPQVSRAGCDVAVHDRRDRSIVHVERAEVEVRVVPVWLHQRHLHARRARVLGAFITEVQVEAIRLEAQLWRDAVLIGRIVVAGWPVVLLRAVALEVATADAEADKVRDGPPERDIIALRELIGDFGENLGIPFSGRLLVEVADRACDRVAPIQRALRAAGDLDPFHVE